MSKIKGNELKPKLRPSALIQLLQRVLIALALVCLLAVVAERLVERPGQEVLAEAMITPVATVEATSLPLTNDPTSTPSPTPRPTAVAPQVTPSPTLSSTAELSFHVVQAGETLTVIARAHDVSVEELVLINELADPDLVYVGQKLVLPRSAAAPMAPEPSSTPPSLESTPILSLASPDEILEGRWIDVDISDQRLTAYEDDIPVRTTLVSTGLPNTPTPVGQFRIWVKFRYDDMAGADYYIEDVPYVMYFHQGYGLHGVTWHGNFGHPMSHGCVNLPTPEAAWLFEWADVGTLVNIHE